MTKIEVLVAHYNGSAFLAEQLESIQGNHLPQNCELLVTIVDDGSRPEEHEKLMKTSSRWRNIRVLTNERNLGVIRTFEKGINQSDADYIMLSDQDDVWLPEKITLTFEKMRQIENGSAALVFTELKTVNADLITISERMLNRTGFDADSARPGLLFQNVVTGCTVMINRRLKEIALPFPVKIPMHDHWLAICAAFAGNLGYVSQPTMLYRQHSDNLVGQPERSLSSRLKKPFKTMAQFRKGLVLKAAQAGELATRMPEGPNKHLLSKVAAAFSHRTPEHLRFLIRTKVFDFHWPSLPLLCALYLIPGGSAGAT